MERVALLEGLTPRNPNLEDYVKVAKGHVPAAAWLYIDRVVDLRTSEAELSKRGETPSNTARWELKKSIEVLRSRPIPSDERRDYTFWKGISHQTFKDIGLLVNASDSPDEIFQKEKALNPWQALQVSDHPAKPITEFKNNIKPSHKVRIDGKDAVQRFAGDKKFYLPEQYEENGRMSSGMIDILRSRDYNLLEALATGYKEAAINRPNDRIVVASSTNYSTGDESRIYLLDLIEALEHFAIIGPSKSVLGDENGKYAGHQLLSVPKRTPTADEKIDHVILDYLNQFYENPPQDPMWWLNARMSCTCPYAVVHSFYKKVKGNKMRMGHVLIDAHIGNSIISNLERRRKEGKHVSLWKYLPVLSAEMVELADKARYQTFIHKDGVHGLREEDINIVLGEGAKKLEGSFVKIDLPSSVNYIKNQLNKF
jgi:hypothetical protein